MKKVFLLIFAFSFCCSLTVKDKIYDGHAEDYVIYEQNRSVLALVVHHLSDERLTIEEISTSAGNKPAHMSWKTWLEQGAPGHTSWLIYDLDPQTGSLIDAYSFSKGCYVSLDDQAPMTAILLKAHLNPIPDSLRKRVGAKPSAVTLATRAIWNPPLFFEGKKEKKSLLAYATAWPDDGSELSKKDLTLYYGENFPFPHWIEISQDHKLRAIDSGHTLNMALRKVPVRKPLITNILKTSSGWEFHIENPSRLGDFALFALDTTHHERETLPLEIQKVEIIGKMTILYVDAKTIEMSLRQGHDYTWMTLSEQAPTLLCESSQKISWN
ncbi:MAG: hypothetical protein P0S94_00790 [Simkaniaceae bacterium]|nr:hypothetical protein [Simkaniaceae bacterium]